MKTEDNRFFLLGRVSHHDPRHSLMWVSLLRDLLIPLAETKPRPLVWVHEVRAHFRKLELHLGRIRYQVTRSEFSNYLSLERTAPPRRFPLFGNGREVS